MTSTLPRTARDIFKLGPLDWVIYNGTIACARCAGFWRYPIPASGDLETMSRMDKIYWLYKAQYPVLRPVKGSQLVAYFEDQLRFKWTLPGGFRPTAELTLSAVGDLMTHPYLPKSRERLYESVEDLIFGPDLSTANLECVLSVPESGTFVMSPSAGPPLYFRPDSFDAIKGCRGRTYSFLSTACNHSLDCGEAGVWSTMATLRREGIAFAGINDTAEGAESATIVEKNGFKLGMVAHTFGLNARKPPTDKPWIVNRSDLNGTVGEIDFTQFEKQIRFCRNRNVDAIVATLHWGMEHEYYPRPDQLDVAHHLAELGIDIIFGHHPHVLQPMEWYRTKRDPERIVPIYYSLGNLVTPFSAPAFRLSGVAGVTLTKGITHDGSSRTYVKHADRIDVFQEIDDENETIHLIRVKEGASATALPARTPRA